MVPTARPRDGTRSEDTPLVVEATFIERGIAGGAKNAQSPAVSPHRQANRRYLLLFPSHISLHPVFSATNASTSTATIGLRKEINRGILARSR